MSYAHDPFVGVILYRKRVEYRKRNFFKITYVSIIIGAVAVDITLPN